MFNIRLIGKIELIKKSKGQEKLLKLMIILYYFTKLNKFIRPSKTKQVSIPLNVTLVPLSVTLGHR